jgi:sialate O-acetylesterase
MMKMKTAWLGGMVAGVLMAGMARADVRLPAIISSRMVVQAERAAPVWGWADPGEEVSVSIGTQTKTTRAGSDGKWMVRLDPLPSGFTGTMTVKGKNTVEIKDVLAGEVWLCSGQSNMAFSLKGAKDSATDIAAAEFGGKFRIFVEQSGHAVAPQAQGKGTWYIINPVYVAGHSAVAFYFGRELQRQLNQPVGLITSSVGGTPIEAWTRRDPQQARPELKPVLDIWQAKQAAYNPEAEKAAFEKRQAAYHEALAKAKAQGKPAPLPPRLTPPPCETAGYPGNLFNGKIMPLIPYGIRGAIWYQGESNARTNSQLYANQLSLLIADWRALWGQPPSPGSGEPGGAFPFAWVQLPNYKAEQLGFPGWCVVRDCQLRALKIPNTGMAITIDLGDPNDIHPKRKREVGQRLALWALAKVYGKAMPFSGPLPVGHDIKGDQVICKFQYADGGLKTRDGGEVKGFKIAGADKNWVMAVAKIEGEKVVVGAPEVKQPVAVRYAWEGDPDCNLINGAGLPASPFRTDAW